MGEKNSRRVTWVTHIETTPNGFADNKTVFKLITQLWKNCLVQKKHNARHVLQLVKTAGTLNFSSFHIGLLEERTVQPITGSHFPALLIVNKPQPTAVHSYSREVVTATHHPSCNVLLASLDPSAVSFFPLSPFFSSCDFFPLRIFGISGKRCGNKTERRGRFVLDTICCCRLG